MGQVQNDHLYVRYRSSSQKNEAEECKSLQTTSLCYSNIKSTLTFLLDDLWLCLGHPLKIQIQVVVVCSFDVYRVSQSGIIMQVKYAKASYVLHPLPVLRPSLSSCINQKLYCVCKY